MLVFAMAVFTLVALMGAGLAMGVFRNGYNDPMFAKLHGGFSLLGSGLVIWEAVEGDERMYINIGMAVVIIVLGIVMSRRRAKGHCVKGLAAAHGLLAVACYAVLGFFTFVK